MTSKVTAELDQALAARIQARFLESWADVDQRNGTGFGAFFHDDAVFDLGTGRLDGRAAIEAAMAARAARGPRSARHVISNIGVHAEDGAVVVDAALVLYAADGPPPLPISPPTAVGDLRDVFAQDDEGNWLITSRVFHPVFIDPDRFAPFQHDSQNTDGADPQSGKEQRP